MNGPTTAGCRRGVVVNSGNTETIGLAAHCGMAEQDFLLAGRS
jgi:hypothetical protein